MKKIVNAMVKCGVISSDDTDIYSFGLQLVFEMLVTTASMLVIAILLKRVAEGVIFFLSFAFLRQYAGGFHAKRFSSCYLISCSIVASVCVLMNYVNSISIFCLAASGVSVLFIGLLAPVDSIYKPIQEKEFKKYRIRTFWFLVSEVIIAIVLFTLDIYFYYCICFSWITLCVLLILGRIQNKRIRQAKTE